MHACVRAYTGHFCHITLVWEHWAHEDKKPQMSQNGEQSQNLLTKQWQGLETSFVFGHAQANSSFDSKKDLIF